VYGSVLGNFCLRQLVLDHELMGQRRARFAAGFVHFRQQGAQLAERTPDLARDAPFATPAIEVRR
jgi:hypothetical protein